MCIRPTMHKGSVLHLADRLFKVLEFLGLKLLKLGGRSMTTWTKSGGRWLKNVMFVHVQG